LTPNSAGQATRPLQNREPFPTLNKLRAALSSVSPLQPNVVLPLRGVPKTRPSISLLRWLEWFSLLVWALPSLVLPGSKYERGRVIKFFKKRVLCYVILYRFNYSPSSVRSTFFQEFSRKDTSKHSSCAQLPIFFSLEFRDGILSFCFRIWECLSFFLST